MIAMFAYGHDDDFVSFLLSVRANAICRNDGIDSVRNNRRYGICLG